MSNSMTKTSKDLPLLPKPKKFWAVCNRYYDDGEVVQFSLMRGPYEPKLEGEGMVVCAKQSEMGRVSYNVKPKDKSILKRASSDEQKEGVLHALLEDLAGGPWRSEDKGRKVGILGGAGTPEKWYRLAVKVNDKNETSSAQSSSGFSEMELMGWLRIVTREMEVRLIGKWANDVNFCSFCGNHANVAGKLITTNNNVRICNECVNTCVGMFKSPEQPVDAAENK